MRLIESNERGEGNNNEISGVNLDEREQGEDMENIPSIRERVPEKEMIPENNQATPGHNEEDVIVVESNRN